MAEAVGIKGVRIEDPAEVETGIAEALAHPGPVLVDAVVNRMELAMPPRVTAEMAKGFTPLHAEGRHERPRRRNRGIGPHQPSAVAIAGRAGAALIHGGVGLCHRLRPPAVFPFGEETARRARKLGDTTA